MSDEMAALDASTYSPVLGIWTDPAPGVAQGLLWSGRCRGWTTVDGELRPVMEWWAEPMAPLVFCVPDRR